jgi:uncharacterized protein (TIGR02001 family)
MPLILAGLASPAAAQVAVELGFQSDYRFRGFSLNDERPVASATLSYDDPTGLYAGGMVVGTFEDGEPELVAAQASLGYAARLTPSLSFDGGASRTEYGSYSFGRNVHYTELYLGLAMRNVTARARYSPDYFRSDRETLYVELDGGLEVAPEWFVAAHVGSLTYLGEIDPYLVRHSWDWRLGGSRRMGPWGVQLEFSGRVERQPGPFAGPGTEDRLRASGTAFVLGLSRTF